MAKGRMINRKIATDSKFNKLDLESQWLYMRMLPFVDDYGRLTGDIFELKYQIIPSSNKEEEWIAICLAEMQEKGLIVWQRNKAIQLLGFDKNQKIGHRKAESIYPNITKGQERSEKVLKGHSNIIQSNIKEIKPIKENTYKEKPKDINMVVDYFKEKNIDNHKQNAMKFFTHYEATGWMRGKTKIRNWKMCLGAWDFNKETNIEKISFKKTTTGFNIAYCSKCNKKQLPNDFQIKQSSCCGTEWLPKAKL